MSKETLYMTQRMVETFAVNHFQTTGERLYLEHGLKGIRGEMANGLLSVKNVALPMIHDAIAAGYQPCPLCFS